MIKIKLFGYKGKENFGSLYMPFEEVLRTSDIITLHAPLTSSTRNMISISEFEMMERCPLVINTSRGGLVDEKALVNALDRNLIAGVGLDVLTSEPPTANNPLLSVLERPNVIVTPHIAWASQEAMQTLWDQCISHIDHFLSGRPSNVLS